MASTWIAGCSFQKFCVPSSMQTASSSRGRARVPAIRPAASRPRLPRDWLERAAEQGVADAESDLAELAVNGVASG